MECAGRQKLFERSVFKKKTVQAGGKNYGKKVRKRFFGKFPLERNAVVARAGLYKPKVYFKERYAATRIEKVEVDEANDLHCPGQEAIGSGNPL